MKLILASQSPGRKQVLQNEGYDFEVVVSDYVEDMTLKMTPVELVKFLSQGKARDIASKRKDAIIIGADTIVLWNGIVMGKPHTVEKSVEMLKQLSGQTHSMITGLTVINSVTGKEITVSDETKITFRNMSVEEIAEYSKLGEGLLKAGGYAYQAVGRKFVEKTEGSETNIIGMPAERLKEVLKQIE